MITLESGPAVVDVSPVDGGRISQITVAGTDLLVSIDGTPGAPGPLGPLSWGCFPMVPWAGRIGHGRFPFQGRWYDVPIRLDQHAIHGTGFVTAWDVLDEGRSHLELQCALDWPFGGTAHQHLQLTPGALVCVLSVLAADRAMPVTIGWHPWFRKPVGDQLRFTHMYERGPDHLPTGRIVAPSPRPWDDCFTGPQAPIRVEVPDAPVVTLTSDCDHWVVFDALAESTCVEPQSGPPDAVNLGAAAVLAPGELLQRTFTISWVALTGR